LRLRQTAVGVIVKDIDRWVLVSAALATSGESDRAVEAASANVLAFLRAEPEIRERIAALLADVREDDSVAADPAEAELPFAPRSMRAFMLWESHYEQSGRMLVKNFFPKPAARFVAGFEKLTGKTFPALKPKKSFFENPAFYVANHTAILADGDEMWMPSHTSALDFELELACVLARPIADPTPEEARAAIGGWFVLNDWSARDVQAHDARKNVFGPVVKSKTFANSIGCDVITADELPDWRTATGRVKVDGEIWCEGSTAGPAHDIGEMIASAAAGEYMDAGDVISTGTMPGCCGLELDRWIKPGQTIELEIDGIGTLTNVLAADARPTTAVRAQ
jgi:2-keto-4-pentenoate hydratase/2-oxohepta-3-ene-1,7-dioic acid hydratase in catechol pathway